MVQIRMMAQAKAGKWAMLPPKIRGFEVEGVANNCCFYGPLIHAGAGASARMQPQIAKRQREFLAYWVKKYMPERATLLQQLEEEGARVDTEIFGIISEVYSIPIKVLHLVRDEWKDQCYRA